MAEALYRKYRPQVFEDVVGQEPIERTLKNAIAQDKLSHAYLFCGPRGTGKTTTARLLAKALLCQSGPTPDPDGTCEDCRLIADGAHPDVYELDAASRTGVENVREEIISRVQFAPTRGRSKVYIIDEVHMLSVAAFNALLKTLEEPPAHVVFLLCTTDPQKVPETIHSRCQRFDFRRIAPESMVSRLGAICIAEGVEFEGEALDLIAHRAEGGLRNALTSLEQIIAFENGKVTLEGAERLLGSIDSNDMAEIMSYVGRRDVASCFRWTANYVETGADLAQFVRDFAEHVRNLYVLALVGDDAELDVSETTRRELAGELQWFGPDRLARLMGVLGDLMAELKTSSNPRLAFEISLTRMVRPDSDLTLESLAERVEALESGYSAVAHVVPGAAAGAPVAVAAAAANAGPAAAGAASEAFAQATVQELPQHQVTQPGRGQTSYQTQVQDWARTQSQVRSQDQVQHRMQQPQPQVESRPAAYEPAPQPMQEQAAPAPAPVQEQPAAASAVSASPAGSLATLANPATLQRIWQAALSNLKKQKQAYGVLFMGTKVRLDEGAGMLKVGFPPENAFAYNAVQKPDVQEALASALGAAAGQAVPFAYEHIGDSARGAAQAAAVGGVQERQVAQQGQPQAQPQAQPQVRVQAQDQVQQPQVQQAQPQAQPQARSQSQARQQAQLQQAQPQQAYDPAPYEQVPYEDAPYDPVPYEEFEAPAPSYGGDFARQPHTVPAQAQPQPQLQARVASVAAAQVASDAATGASPLEPNLTPDGAIAEDPADVQALLQAGFGGGVIFSEVED